MQLDPVRASVGWADPSQFEEPPAPPDETSPEGHVYNNPLRPGTVCFDNFMRVECEQLLPVIGSRTGRRQVAGVETRLEREYLSSLTFSSGFTSQEAGEVVGTEANRIQLWRLISTTVVTAGFVGGEFQTAG